MSPRGPRKPPEPEVFAFELALGQFPIMVEEKKGRPGYVVMRRYLNGEQKQKAIGRMVLRDERGAVLESAIAAAKDKATEWYRQITGAEPNVETRKVTVCTIGQTWRMVSDPATGKYPHKTPFRDELERALTYAALTWGSDTAWNAIDADSWTMLMRKRLSEQVQQNRTGLRSTEITVSRILTAANWLKEGKKIPMDAALIKPEWRDAMRQYWMGLTEKKSVPAPNRPRFTDEESRRLIAVSWDVDPRFGLMMALGAELRLGQVARAKRSDLDLSAGTFIVHGAGDKKGETIELTVGQSLAVQRAFEGYLREAVESGEDFHLFPGGRMLGKKAGEAVAKLGQAIDNHVNENTIRDWYWSAEKLAGIARVKGRGVYGVRRAAVDHALDVAKVSQSGLKALGGWSSDDVPRRIYKDQENRAGRKEAATARASFRGEN